MSNVTVDSLDIYIDDATSQNTSNTQLQMVFDSTSIHKGSFTKVKIGFVNSSITSTKDIIVNVIPAAASTADTTNYTGIPKVIKIPKDSNYVTFFLQVPNNYKIEGTTVLQFADTAS
jgi:hypothetical protein